MKAVQTFWTNKNLPISQMTGGWLDARYHFMSWALSASLLSEHFEETVLHTDTIGKKILIDYLRLPYKEVHITQKNLEKYYPKNWWVMRKIHTYSLIDSPFIHVDGDAFLWKGLPAHFANEPIIVQNMQLDFGCYNMALDQLNNAGISVPAFFDGSASSYDAVNMGIVGGTDYHFFKTYVSEIKQFYNVSLRKKLSSEHLVKTGYLNTLLEECFFYQLAGTLHKRVTPLITEPLDDSYSSLANCMDSRFPLTHLIGQNKQNIFHSKQIEFQLQQRFPEVYLRVKQFLNKFAKEPEHFQSYRSQDPFGLSNALCKKEGYNRLIHAGNIARAKSNFRKEGKDQILDMLNFEQAKSKKIRFFIQNKEKFLDHQRIVSQKVIKISNCDLQFRLADKLRYNPDFPILSVRSPYPQGITNYALVYDFESEYEHITHRSLDDLSLFILYNAANGTSLQDLLQCVLKKTGTETNRTPNIIRNTDLKVRELVSMGLLNYEFAISE